MSDVLALVADSQSAMRGLLARTPNGLGYEVIGVGDAIELAQHVHREELLLRRELLLVLDAQLASRCAVPVSVAATRRWHQHLPSPKVILIYEWGTLGAREMPDLHHCETIAVLETPFHMQELATVAQRAMAEVA